MMQDYATDFWRGMDDLHGFSFYRNPIQNIEPCRAITVVDVYRYLVGHYAKPQTDTLRSLTSPTEAKKYKATHFDYCTFSGLFRKRNEKELIQHSGLLCLDFDHVGNPDRFKELQRATAKARLLRYGTDVHESLWRWREVDYPHRLERLGTFPLFQGCSQLH